MGLTELRASRARTGEVFLTNLNSLLPNIRAGKEEGQSNFINPGIQLLNLGIDFELTPTLKLITNGKFDIWCRRLIKRKNRLHLP